MQIEHHYPLRIEHWSHSPNDKFMGIISDNGYNYIFGISPEDPNEPECCYFNIWIEKKMVNETTNSVVFYAKTYSGFKIKNSFQKPAVEFFFSLIELATSDFALQFHQRVQKTNLAYQKIQKPILSVLKKDIEKTIDIWDRTIRNRVFVAPPNWQIKFRNLPEIPDHKKWVKGSYTTLEQDISFKLLNQQPITSEEEKVFVGLTRFYEELDKQLSSVNYDTFTEEDFENFKNYILYAFNYNALMTNKIIVFQTYRLVVNEWVTGRNESITSLDFLKYPSLEKVKKSNKYNRANTPQTNIFYSTGNIDTALKEIRPPENKLVTVGIWKPRDTNKSFVSFPISHSDAAFAINKSVQKSTLAFEEQINSNSALFMNYMRYYFKLLGREFTKRTTNHYQYFISALFSEQILGRQDQTNDDYKYDCIVFPSVGNDYFTDNFAILPITVDKDFLLTEAIEFEVEEAYYDKAYILQHPEAVTLAKIRNVKRTSAISEQGELKW